MKNWKTESNKDSCMVTGNLENSNEVVDHRALINVMEMSCFIHNNCYFPPTISLITVFSPGFLCAFVYF